MRCGLVRLVTRRCPYDVKIRRKAWSSSQKGGETSALNQVAESRLIGRYCAHKVCRLVEKSSKFVCKVLSGTNITSRKLSSTKSPLFDYLSDYDYRLSNVKSNEAPFRNQEKNQRTKCNLNSAHGQSSKLLIRLQNYSTNDRNGRNPGKIKPARPYHVHSKSKCYPYKRYSVQRLASKKNTFANQKKIRNKNINSKKLFVVESPFITYHTSSKQSKYLKKLKQCSVSPYESLDKSDYGQGFLDHKVLNHLNETSYLSLCGCETCDRKLKHYEKKNTKINHMLQNKISKILNYCKKKNPFYKIYCQGDNPRTHLDMREYGMHGINGWLNYLDSCECTDWSQYKLGKHDSCYSNLGTKNKCVNTAADICDPTLLTNKHQNSLPNCQESCKGENVTEEQCLDQNPQFSDVKDPNKHIDQNNVEGQGNFAKKDNSTTQTQDHGEAPVTNYYYITNNTLNAKCCCKEEHVNNENCSKYDEDKFKNDLNRSNDENCCYGFDDKVNKPGGNEKYGKTAFNSFCKTMNKVYDVMMKPVNENEIFEQDENNYEGNLNVDTKACNANNFEYYDCESYQQYNMWFDRGDVRRNTDANVATQILNFDDFMDMKFRDMKDEKKSDKFLHYDDHHFKEMAKISSNKDFDNIANCGFTNERSKDCPIKNCTECSKNVNEHKCKEKLKIPSQYESGQQNESIAQGENMLFYRELGPLDHLNQFMSNNSQRYEEKAQILTRGPNFSHFPDSNWRTSLFRYDKKLSETFDVSDPCIIDSPIKIDTDKTKDLSKYSEINIAIEKVKKKIHDIMNEPDEKPSIGKDRSGKSNQCNKRVNIPRQGLLKQNPTLSDNRLESVNNFNCGTKFGRANYSGCGKDGNYSESKNVKNTYDKRDVDRCVELEQTNQPPSSVHLNQIIEAIKENRNAHKFVNIPSKKTNKRALDERENKGYKVYCAPFPQSTHRKMPLKNNLFVFKPGTEPIFGSANTESLVYQANFSRHMATSSKYRRFLAKQQHKINNKPHKSNFMDGTIFSTDNFISEGWDNEKTRKIEKRKSYLKYMENRLNPRENERVVESTTEQLNEESHRNFTTLEYDYQPKNGQEELYKKSFDIFSRNSGVENGKFKKTEYCPVPTISGVVDRYSDKVLNEKDRYSRRESDINKEAKEKRWKIWDPKDWENEGNNCHAEMISKGFCNTDRDDDENRKSPEGNEIIFNERLEKTKSGFNDNCVGVKSVMNNDARRRFDRFNYRSDNHPTLDDSNCINVGDLGLNLTSFSLSRPDPRLNARKKDRVLKGKEGEPAKFLNASQAKINNLGVANTSMSKQADLRLREIRTVGLRPYNKNDMPHNSFRIRNSFLMDSKNTFRPLATSNTFNKRQASSGIMDGAGFKSTMSDKLKNMERIDKVDYLKEDKYMSNKEPVETIKVKESFVSPTNKIEKSSGIQESSENKKCFELGMCSKEVEKRTKNRTVVDLDMTKQTTEEMNVSGLFPEGKKTVHGKIVSVLAKPKVLSTSLKNRSRGLEAIKTSDFKEPITVQVVYETTTDQSVGEHIEKAKRKVYVGDIKKKTKTPVKLFNRDDYRIENEIVKQTYEPTLPEESNTQDTNYQENESQENKSSVWKKYDPKNNGLDSKKYYVELKKLMKNKKANADDITAGEKTQSQGDTINWQAPRNPVYEKLVNRDGVENEWVQGKSIDSSPKKSYNTEEEKELNITVVSRKSDEETPSNTENIKLSAAQKNKGKVNVEEIIKEKETKEEPKSIYHESEKDLDEELVEHSGPAVDDKVKPLERKSDMPTSGEAKYEIDSDSFDRGAEDFDEKEKLVITHFKQFLRPEKSDESREKTEGTNLTLEASMLKMTLFHDKNVEIQSIESLSNQVEHELNHMVLPYIKDMVMTEPSNQNLRSKVEFKPKEYYLNMVDSNSDRQTVQITKHVPEENQEVKHVDEKIEEHDETSVLTNKLYSVEKLKGSRSHPEAYTKMSAEESIKAEEESIKAEEDKIMSSSSERITKDEEKEDVKDEQLGSERLRVQINSKERDISNDDFKEEITTQNDAVFSQVDKNSKTDNPKLIYRSFYSYDSLYKPSQYKHGKNQIETPVSVEPTVEDQIKPDSHDESESQRDEKSGKETVSGNEKLVEESRSKTDENDELSENADVSQQRQPRKTPSKYDTILKELKMMFVKENTTNNSQEQEEFSGNEQVDQKEKKEDRLSGKNSSEKEEEKGKPEFETPQIENKLSENSTGEAEGEIKEYKNTIEERLTKPLDSTSFLSDDVSLEDLPLMPQDVKAQILDTKNDKKTNDKSKQKTKSSYKSYESVLKPALYSKKKVSEKISKVNKTMLQKSKSEYENYTKSKTPITKSKTKSSYKSFYSYDSLLKPSLYKNQKQEVQSPRSPEPTIQEQIKPGFYEETKLERAEKLAKEFSSRNEMLADEFHVKTEKLNPKTDIYEEHLKNSSLSEIKVGKNLKTDREEVPIKDYVREVTLVDDVESIKSGTEQSEATDESKDVGEKKTTTDSLKSIVDEQKIEIEKLKSIVDEQKIKIEKVSSAKESAEDSFIKPSTTKARLHSKEDEIRATEIKTEAETAESEPLKDEIMPISEKRALSEIKEKDKSMRLKEKLKSISMSKRKREIKEEKKMAEAIKMEKALKEEVKSELKEEPTVAATKKLEKGIREEPKVITSETDVVKPYSSIEEEIGSKEKEIEYVKEAAKISVEGEKKIMSTKEEMDIDFSEDSDKRSKPKTVLSSFYSYDSNIKTGTYRKDSQISVKESAKADVKETAPAEETSEEKKKLVSIAKGSRFKDKMKKRLLEKPKIKDALRLSKEARGAEESKKTSLKQVKKDDEFIKPSSATVNETEAEANKVINEIIPKLSQVIPKVFKEQSLKKKTASKKETGSETQDKRTASRSEKDQKASWEKPTGKDVRVKDAVVEQEKLAIEDSVLEKTATVQAKDLAIEDTVLEKTASVQAKALAIEDTVLEKTASVQDTAKAEMEKKTEPPEEEFEIMASSFTQYEEREREDKRIENIQDKVPYLKDDEPEEVKTDKAVKAVKKRVTPLQNIKPFVPYERERTDQEVELEQWEKQPTYLKNLRPSFYKIKKVDMRHKNYEYNEKKFKDLKLLNKITSMNKVSDCTCKKGEKWVADMCCSLEEQEKRGKENKEAKEAVQSENSEEAFKNQPVKGNVVRSGRGYRSTDWPDNLSRKKDAVIKQPLTPKPPWRN